MLARHDRLPDFCAPLSSGDLFILSDDADGLPVVIIVGAPALEVSVSALVIHVDAIAHPALHGMHVLDDGSIAAALTDGRPGVVVAGRDHRVLASGPVDAIERLIAVLARAPRAVPLLMVDDVFEPGLCDELIAHLDRVELVGSPSFTHGDDRHRALRVDQRLKARLDHIVSDAGLLAVITNRLQTRLLPEVARSLAHRPTSLETPKIVSYPAGAGWFTAHRDNVTADSAHRLLAVTINLDSDYVGGELRFPEFSDTTYRPPTGSAIVFSCGLLHEVTPVVSGERRAVVTFLW